MIRDFEFYHGLVFARIVHGMQRPVSFQQFQPVSNGSYVVDDAVGIYIKYSSKRMTPWRFTFMAEHQREIDLLEAAFKRVFLVLVCSDDGVVCLSYAELKQLLDNQHNPIEWISATRHKREMYSIKGSNGELDFKIGQNEFPAKLFRERSPSAQADQQEICLGSFDERELASAAGEPGGRAGGPSVPRIYTR